MPIPGKLSHSLSLDIKTYVATWGVGCKAYTEPFQVEGNVASK